VRKTKLVTIEASNRDQGKTYLLTEMAASQAEKWAARAFLALAKSGIEIPDEAANAGMAGIATAGLQALGGIQWELAEPLLDEMFKCVKIKMPLATRELIEDDIEEVSTRLFLRKELLELHLGFSLTESRSESAPVSEIPMQTSPITKMFPAS